jgi:hypothetical protein
MRNWSKFLAYFLILMILISCSKDEGSLIFTTYKYKIYLNNGLVINKVEYFESNKLAYSKLIIYGEDLVEERITNILYNYFESTYYYLNSNNQADSSMTSHFSDSVLSSKTITYYKYDLDGYKIESKISRYNYSHGNITSQENIEFDYEIIDGNNTIVYLNIYNRICAHYYRFNDLLNKINLESLSADFKGKKNRNLIESIRSDCHDAPSTAPPKSRFAYSLDANGFVIKRVEDYTSSYDPTDQYPQKEIRTTKYEYYFE